MSYDPSLVQFAFILQIIEFTLCALMVCICVLYVRKVAFKNWSTFNIVLLALMILSIILTAMAGIAPRETIAYRLGLDVLPIDYTMLLVDAVVTSAAYFEFLICEIYISYLRALSILQLRPKREQYLLKIGVFGAMIFFQASMACFMLNFLAGFSLILCQITGAFAGWIYFIIDFYYLFHFIQLIRQLKKTKVDKKLVLIAKYGIFNALIFLTTLVFFIVNGSGLVLLLWVSISPWITTAAIAKMGYELELINNEATTSVSIPISFLDNK